LGFKPCNLNITWLFFIFNRKGRYEGAMNAKMNI
jgi:hypothetical protein